MHFFITIVPTYVVTVATMMSIDYSLFNDKGVKIRLEWLRQLTRTIQCLFKETFWTKKGNFESLNRSLHLRSFYALRTSELVYHQFIAHSQSNWLFGFDVISSKSSLKWPSYRTVSRVVCKSVRRSWVKRSLNIMVFSLTYQILITF